MMNTGIFVFLGVLVGTGILALLKVERLVKLAFGSYVSGGLGIALGAMLEYYVQLLSRTPEAEFFSFRYQQYADFLSNAQPTIVLVLCALLLWYFVQYSYLRISISEMLIEKRLQTAIWALLSLGSLISSLYFSLRYFGGGLYNWLFESPEVGLYSQYFPLMWVVVAVLVILFASRFPFRLGISKVEGLD